MSSGAKKVFLLSGCAISVYAIFVFAFQSLMSFWCGLWLCALGMITLIVVLQSWQIYFTPVILAMLFLLSYVASSTELLLNYEDYLQSPWYGAALSRFDWTDREVVSLLAVISNGVAGLLLGVLCANSCSRRLLRKPSSGVLPSVTPPININLYVWLALWLIGSLVLWSVLAALGIGRTGLLDRVVLPYGINGILSLSGRLVLPIIALYILGAAVSQKAKKVIAVLLTLALIEAMVASVVAGSRATFVMHFGPIAFYLLAHRGVAVELRRMAIRYTFIGFCFLLVALQVVNSIRSSAFTDFDIRLFSVASGTVDIDWTFGLYSSLTTFLNLLTKRTGGIMELICVLTASDLGGELFYGGLSGLPALDVNQIVLGLSLGGAGDMNVGVGFGLFGSLFLSGSMFVVLLGTFAFTLVGIAIEELTRRMGLEAVATGLSLIIAMNIGDYWYWLRMKKELLAILGPVLILAWLSRAWLGKPLNTKSSEPVVGNARWIPRGGDYRV